MVSDYSFTAGTDAPWVLITKTPVSQEYVPDGVLLVELNGASMTSLSGMYREFSDALRLPDYFGNNFNALDECITDLEWLPADGYLLVVRYSELLLNEESDDVLEGLLSLLERAGEAWSEPVAQGEAWDCGRVPFHTILAFSENKMPAFQARLDRLSLTLPALGA